MRRGPAEAPAELEVSMFHHPYGWLEPQNAREFKVFVEERSDLVLTGHEHVSDAYIKIRPNGDADTFLEGRAMWDTRETETGLNVVLVDGEAKLGGRAGSCTPVAATPAPSSPRGHRSSAIGRSSSAGSRARRSSTANSGTSGPEHLWVLRTRRSDHPLLLHL